MSKSIRYTLVLTLFIYKQTVYDTVYALDLYSFFTLTETV